MLSGVDVPHSDNTFKSQFLAKPEHIHIWIVRIIPRSFMPLTLLKKDFQPVKTGNPFKATK